jgi:hypothetical protein
MFEALKRALPLLALLIITTVTVAHAGVLGDIWNGVKDQAMGVIMGGVALGLNGLLGWLHNKNAARFNMVTKTMAETGEFLTTLGTAIQDAKVTREELGATLKEGADVVNVFRPTPAKYVTSPGDPEMPRALSQ